MSEDQSAASGGRTPQSGAAPNVGTQTASADPSGASGLSRVAGSRVRYWIKLSGIVIPALLVVSFVILWLFQRDRIPKDVPVSTALSGSSYHVFGQEFCKVLNRQLPSKPARVVLTTGSKANVENLKDRQAQLAMYQGGTVELHDELHDAVAVAPLYHEVVHVLVKKQVLNDAKYQGRPLTGDLLRDLLSVDGREVYAGPGDSGMRYSAREILEHYGIEFEEVNWTGKETPSTEVVISTTGIFSKTMQNRLQGGNYRYLSVDADAIADRHAHFTRHTIYKASYRDENRRPVPDRDVDTVATAAFLIVRRDASPRLVSAALDVLYQGELGRKHPQLIPLADARPYLHGMPVHETARALFNPYDLGYLASVIESLAGTKELIVAFGAGLYLVWTLRRRREERLRHAEMEANRVRLAQFVDRTVAIESRQIGVTDPARLAQYLEEVTRIKLEALDELTDAELRGDRSFSIFLLQCANLINKLQLKIIAHRADAR